MTTDDGDEFSKPLLVYLSWDNIWEPKADTICCGQIQQHLREYRDAICDCHILLWTNATTFETVMELNGQAACKLTKVLVVYYLATTFRSQKLTQFVVAKIQQYLREYRDTICWRRLLYFVVNEGYNIQKVAATGQNLQP